MRRRSGTSDETVKAQRHRAATLKRRNEPKAVREHSPSIAALQDELDRRTRERDEALEQQTATSEILASISGSMTDPKPVFDAIVRNLLRLLGTRFASVSLLHDGIIEMPAADGMPGIQSLTQLYPRPLDDTTVGGQAMLSRQVVQYAPIIGNAAVPATAQKIARDFSYNSIISAPMIRQDKVFGAISAAHHESRAFDGKGIALIKAFADQAVIAIENARLLNELRQRTDDLSVSLQQQTATADVLKVISRSTFDLQVVLNTLVESAARLCDSDHAWLFRRDGEVYRWATGYGLSREGHEQIKQYQQALAHSPGRGSIVGRTALEGQPVQIVDVLADPEYVLLDLQKIGNYRTVLGIPLLRESLPTGVLVLTRSEPRPFTSKQIELLTTFADQAVIAIENVRLFEAEQQRTRELTESLEQQTATSEVLQVISSSPGDLQPVFETMLEKAVSICDAKYGNIYRWDGEFLHLLAAHDTPPALAEFRRRSALRPSLIRRMVETKTAIHVIDVAADPEYLERRTPSTVAAVELGGVRSFLSVPMLKENELIGSFSLYRQEVRPFTDKQIALVTSFASQAVIAIENARLLNELRESLQQQTATADVLKVISRSTFDLQTVLDTLTASAARLCDADFAFIFQRFGDLLHHAASHGFSSDFIEYQKQNPIPLGRGSLTGRTALEGKMVHIPDVLEDPEYTWTKSIELAQYRTMLGIPLSREGVPIGVIALSRRTVRPFTDRQIELMTTFADQAVIAIENARLLNELRESLEQQTATSKVLDVISRSAFDLRAVFEAVIESSVRLCGADRGHFYRFDGELLRVAAAFNASRELMEFVERTPIPPGRNSASGRAMVECRTVHIPDCLADPEYSWGGKDVDPVRTILAVPTLKGNDLLGMIVIYRLEVSPFTDKQIALVETFADQAAIAIENVRLLDALRQRTDELGRSVGELRALGEVSQAVNSTLDLETVLSTIVAKAVQLSGTEAGAIYVFDNRQRQFHLRATYGMDRELIDALTHADIGVNEPNIALILAERELIQVADLKEEAPSDLNEITLRAGYRARLVAPLIRGEDVVGLLVVRRKTPGAFPPNTVDLIKTFAAQSAVAIENARLFHNVEILAGGFANRAGPPGADGKARLARPTDRWYCARDQEPAQFRQQFLGRLGRTHRRIAGGAWRRAPRQQAARRDQRDRRYAARQSRQGRAARQARRRDRQEHAVAFASGLWRAPAGRYQRPGR